MGSLSGKSHSSGAEGADLAESLVPEHPTQRRQHQQQSAIQRTMCDKSNDISECECHNTWLSCEHAEEQQTTEAKVDLRDQIDDLKVDLGKQIGDFLVET